MRTSLLCVTLAFAQADLERVFHFTNTRSPQSLQEIATVVRSMTELRDLKVDAGQKTLTFSGSQAQGALADWILIHLDKRTANLPSPPRFEAQFDQDRAVKIFYLRHTHTPQTLQELATAIRTVVTIPRLFVYQGESAIVVRGTPDQVMLAEWMVEQLDGTARPTATAFRWSGSDDLVRLFQVPWAATPQRLQEIAVKFRRDASIRLLMTYNPSKVIAARGSAAQLAQAEQIVSSSSPRD